MKNRFNSSKAAVIAIMFFLLFSIVLAAIPVAKAAGAITLTPTTQTPGGSVTIIGSGFGAQKPVGIGFGAEVNVINEELEITGPYDIGTGPYIGYVSHMPFKPGSYTKAINVSSTLFLVVDTDNGNGTFTAPTADFLNGTLDYVTGKITLHLKAPIPTTPHYVNIVNYTYYQYDVTPAAGVTTFATGTFQATITVPDVYNGDYTITAIDPQGNIATATLTVTGGEDPPVLDWPYDWPKFRNDLHLTGYSDSPAPETNQTLWVYEMPSNYMLFSSPAVADGRVFFGAYLMGGIFCLDAAYGVQLWNYSTGSLSCSPAVAYGRVYAGTGDDNIYCLDAATGALIWNYTVGDTGGAWSSSPAVVDGKVYIGSSDDNLYCLDAMTGALIWNYTTGADIYASSPIVANGKVYVGSMDFNVYCFDAATGTKLWNYTTGNEILGTGGYSNGRIYWGSTDGILYCLDATTGEKIWDYLAAEADGAAENLAIAYDNVYLSVAGENVLHCIDATTGEKIWNYTTEAGITSPPAVADGKVYFSTPSMDGCTYCLDATTGAFIWSYNIRALWMVSSPAVANGVVYVTAGSAGKVYAFGTEVIPEGLTIGVMLLLSTIAVIVGTRYYRKRPKWENW